MKNRHWPVPPLIASLPPDARRHYEKPINSGTWYPYSAFTGFLEALERLYGYARPSLLRDVSREMAVRDFSVALKLLFTVAKMEFVVRRAQVMWARHCNRGMVWVRTYTPVGVDGELQDFPEVHPLHCRYNEGWLDGLFLGLGAQDPKTTQTRCVHRGDPVCAYDITWTRLKRLFG